MGETSLAADHAQDPLRQSDAGSSRAPAWLSWALATAILLGAFLLFQVQPLIGRYILPWFGGGPAVWTTAMLFFQVALFAGYAYAHGATRWLSPRGQAWLHFALLGAALCVLPIVPGAAWKPSDGEHPTWRILCLLAATVGAPYFVLSTTGPLMQAWFAHAYSGRSPYRLYALSNIGSLAALLSYPFIVEPRLRLSTQAELWSWGFGLFAAVAVLCAASMLRLPRASAGDELSAVAGDYQRPGWLQRLLWLLLPAWGSMVLLATTNFLCQDMAPAPFLWVVPLSLYLLSFIIAFDSPRWYRRLPASTFTLILLSAVAVGTAQRWLGETGESLDYAKSLALYLAALFGVCLLCHGEAAKLRPPPRRLTEFYLMLSAGGALGGAFVSLAAPRLFTTHFEWPLAVAGSLLLSIGILSIGLVQILGFPLRGLGFQPERSSFEVKPEKHRQDAYATKARQLAAAGCLAGALGAVAAVAWSYDKLERPYFAARNFYGSIAVLEREADDPNEHHFLFRSGSTTHGRQFADLEKRKLPVSYYAPKSGVGLAARRLADGPPARVGVVGLGVGTMAAYARPGDHYRFYEINPAVADMARRHFHYLGDCRGECEIVMGDARLSLDREPPQHFDLLVLDAFSSDSIPVHLLAKEAFEIYGRHLDADSVLAVHISNRHLDLEPVVRKQAEYFGYQYVRIDADSNADLVEPTEYMLLSGDRGFFDSLPAESQNNEPSTLDVPQWTDDFSNLYQILRHKQAPWMNRWRALFRGG